MRAPSILVVASDLRRDETLTQYRSRVYVARRRPFRIPRRAKPRPLPLAISVSPDR
jgi:hypothetical protein